MTALSAAFLRRSAGLLSLLAILIAIAPAPVRADQPVTGTYCSDEPGLLRFLAVEEQADGNLAFGVSLWVSMHNCGLIGTAMPVAGGWRFDDPETDCVLDIVQTDNGLLLQTEGHHMCQHYCGARARLTRVEFPFAIRRRDSVEPGLLGSPERLMNAPC